MKKVLFFSLIVFLLLQFYQPARNSNNGQVLPIHIAKVYNIPTKVQQILQNSCYDCHSNNTHYPWYSYLQPSRFLMEYHIKTGKENLNFSEWGNYSKRRQESKLDRIAKQIESNEMPLASYTLIHQKAKLSEQQKQDIITWITTITTDE
ncbi:heme-binding domain-containing protein [Emticicia sp. W12TSBA100-4]|uniref:heme-binding domain-containing protein n=1 Tax=Emticicia sp. W12TSBA100-4 TaxID=3160965 RepID=UPI00330678CA